MTTMTITLPDTCLEDTLESAIGSRAYGLHYWATLEGCETTPSGLTVTLVVQDTGRRYRVSAKTLRRGLQRAAVSHPALFAAVVSGQADAPTSESIVQLALFGKIVYG